MSDNRAPSSESSRALLHLVRRARRRVLVLSVVGLRLTSLHGQHCGRGWCRHHRLIHVHDHIEVLGAVHPERALSEYVIEGVFRLVGLIEFELYEVATETLLASVFPEDGEMSQPLAWLPLL